jgi:hypothetical protein
MAEMVKIIAPRPQLPRNVVEITAPRPQLLRNIVEITAPRPQLPSNIVEITALRPQLPRNIVEITAPCPQLPPPMWLSFRDSCGAVHTDSRTAAKSTVQHSQWSGVQCNWICDRQSVGQ